MGRFKSFILQNKNSIIFVVTIVIFILLVIQLLNFIVKENKNYTQNGTLNNGTSSNTSSNSGILYDPKTSPVVDSPVTDKAYEEHNDIIKSFINACNNQLIEEAYNLLTDECKQEIYPTLNDFTKSYYNLVFKTERTYSAQYWNRLNNSMNTYKVRILDDILATGKYTGTEAIDDYYTIVKIGDEYKLNISNFIGKQSVEKSNKQKDITIEVLDKYIYMDYEKYSIRIKNESENTILLDTKKGNRNTYVVDDKETKYSSYINEVLDNKLIVKSGYTVEFKVNFNKLYNPNTSISRLVFSDIVLNYEEYLQSNNKEEFERTSITVYL